MSRIAYVIGSAFGSAGSNVDSADGPIYLQNSAVFAELSTYGIQCIWDKILKSESQCLSKLELVAWHCDRLALEIERLIQQQKFFIVLGGDHSCAIGTWSGASNAMQSQGPLGLIWIDAHMDSHIVETSISGNIHGMPLAALLGQGSRLLTHLRNPYSKFNPKNVCLIGVRSFEEAEATLLRNLKVRVFFMDEIKRRGIKAVMQEALEIVSYNTVGFGISLDIDSIDPIYAPATGVLEPNGIEDISLCHALQIFSNNKLLIGMEIVEFIPKLDRNYITEKLIMKIVVNLLQGRDLR